MYSNMFALLYMKIKKKVNEEMETPHKNIESNKKNGENCYTNTMIKCYNQIPISYPIKINAKEERHKKYGTEEEKL